MSDNRVNSRISEPAPETVLEGPLSVLHALGSTQFRGIPDGVSNAHAKPSPSRTICLYSNLRRCASGAKCENGPLRRSWAEIMAAKCRVTTSKC